MTGLPPKQLIAIPTLEPANSQAYPDWTAGRVKRAFARAQEGDLELVADLCEAVKSDGRIRGVFQTRINALLGTKLEFEANAEGDENSGENVVKNEVTRALDEGGEWWDIAPEPVLSQIFYWGLVLNIALAEIVWEQDPERNNVWSPRLHVKHPRNLRWDMETRKWFLKVVRKGAKGAFGQLDTEEIEVTPGDGRWLMYQPFGSNTPWLHGLIWPLSLIFIAKAYAEYDWGRRNEARGRAALVGKTPQGSLDEDRVKFAAQIAELRYTLGMVLAPDHELEAIEFGVDDHQTFDKKIQNSDAAFAILILGQNLTTEVRQSGSYAAGRAQERVRQDYLEQDAENAATQLRKQLLVPFALHRFGSIKLAPFPKWETTPPENITQKANIIARASEALDRMLLHGVDVDIEAFGKQFGIPLKSGKLKPPPAPPPTAPPTKPAKKKPEKAA